MSDLRSGRQLISKALFGGFALLSLTAFANAGVTSLVDPGFDGQSAGPITDNGGQGQWASYGDNGDGPFNFTVETGIAHTGTQAVTNAESFTSTPSGFTLLYQYETADSPATLDGQKVSFSFWLYYDPTMPGQNQSSDNIGYDFDSRDTSNVDSASSTGTINASTLSPATWTEFSGSFVVPPTSDATLLAAVLIAPSGTWYADDFSESIPTVVVPEPTSMAAVAMLAGALLARRRRSPGSSQFPA